jgi:hypothetical protein
MAPLKPPPMIKTSAEREIEVGTSVIERFRRENSLHPGRLSFASHGTRGAKQRNDETLPYCHRLMLRKRSLVANE